jgi:pilus assembly protein CpaB
MNIKRISILGVAAIAAGLAAFLVRGMLTNRPVVQAAAPAPTIQILVAAKDVTAGHLLDPTLVRWQPWPEKAMMTTFINNKAEPDVAKAIAGAVVRMPLSAGQPITEASIVRAGGAGFMAATVTAGMRAIGVPVTAETSAGGFILPNDRVDVVLTRQLPSEGKSFESITILSDVRVLAVDQTAHQGKDQETVIGKTATLELTEKQSELVTRAQQSGVLSLALRSIGDSDGMPIAKNFPNIGAPEKAAVVRPPLIVYRYGVLRGESAGAGGATPGPAPAEAPAAEAPAPQQTASTEGAAALESPR